MAAIIGIDSDELANIINEFNDLDNKYHKVLLQIITTILSQ